MTQVRHFVYPKPVRSELKNATVRFFLNQREGKGIAIKCDRLLIGVGGTFDRDIGAARKLRSIKFGNHVVDLNWGCASVNDGRLTFERPFSLITTPPRHSRNRSRR